MLAQSVDEEIYLKNIIYPKSLKLFMKITLILGVVVCVLTFIWLLPQILPQKNKDYITDISCENELKIGEIKPIDILVHGFIGTRTERYKCNINVTISNKSIKFENCYVILAYRNSTEIGGKINEFTEILYYGNKRELYFRLPFLDKGEYDANFTLNCDNYRASSNNIPFTISSPEIQKQEKDYTIHGAIINGLFSLFGIILAFYLGKHSKEEIPKSKPKPKSKK